MAAVVRWNNTEGKVKVERRQMGGGKLRVNLGNKCKRSQLPQIVWTTEDASFGVDGSTH